MVIRVYPDGRPVVDEQKRPLPKDEDVDEFRYSRLPSVEEIEANSRGAFYGKVGRKELAVKRPSFVTDKFRRQDAPAAPLRFRDGSLPYERRTLLRGTVNEHGARYY